MLPENTYSSIPIGAHFVTPDDKVTTALVDYEMGGVALNDPSQGLTVKTWKVFVVNQEVFVQANAETPVYVFTGVNITEIALCFDQNMRPCVAHVDQGELKLRWYDTFITAFRIDNFGPAHRNPKLSLDDKRPLLSASSDMILAYIRGDTLYYRQQRDRFEIERTLKTGIKPYLKLKNIGMSHTWRMQFELV
jgi:hypothetical protein